ncbi:regulatory protein GemA [uncultured Psychrobacter sp.]|uniref:gp16 family protein n=1 Tax=uncultured Psychrobacter sp. TaxID=259303 RepID=UPI00259146F7|nr:regulatory protein GemA [uncultured Psychrobacter sp.]
MSQRTPNKPKLIQFIHIAKSQLKLDDATYRHMLTEQTGKDSCSKMSKSELVVVFEHLKSLGFKTTPAKSAGKVAQADDAQSRKIRSLWLTLHDLGAVRNASERALAKYVERQTGKSALQFISTEDASRVIETLKKWQQRVEDTQLMANIDNK